MTGSSSRARATTRATVVTIAPVSTASRAACGQGAGARRSWSASATAVSTATAPAPLLSGPSRGRAPASRGAPWGRRRAAPAAGQQRERHLERRERDVEGELERRGCGAARRRAAAGATSRASDQLAGVAVDQPEHERDLGEEDHARLALALQHQPVRLGRREQRGQHRPGQVRVGRREGGQRRRQRQHAGGPGAQEHGERRDEARGAERRAQRPHDDLLPRRSRVDRTSFVGTARRRLEQAAARDAQLRRTAQRTTTGWPCVREDGLPRTQRDLPVDTPRRHAVIQLHLSEGSP